MSDVRFQAVPQNNPNALVFSDYAVENQNRRDSRLYVELKQAKDTSANPVELVLKSCVIFCNSSVFSVLLVLLTILPIAALVIGALKKDDCPIQGYIPVWLMVSGACGVFSALVKILTNVCADIRKREGELHQGMVLNFLRCFNVIVVVFGFSWLIIGGVWVYSVYNRVQHRDPLSFQYCDQLCYLFAFCIITILLSILGLLVGSILAAILLYCASAWIFWNPNA